MKWTHYFFLLLLVPSLAFSYFQEKDADKIEGKVLNLWKSHEQLLQQFGVYGLEEKMQHLDLLKKSIECCQKALSYYDKILKEISYKPKKTRQSPPWPQVKKRCEQSRAHVKDEIGRLQNLLQTVQREGGAFLQAQALYQQVMEKASLAAYKSQNFPPEDVGKVKETVSALLEIANLYEEAASYAQQALNVLSVSSDEQSKNVLRQAHGKYQEEAIRLRREADEWMGRPQPELIDKQADESGI